MAMATFTVKNTTTISTTTSTIITTSIPSLAGHSIPSTLIIIPASDFQVVSKDLDMSCYGVVEKAQFLDGSKGIFAGTTF
jgi:hypothetical protein